MSGFVFKFGYYTLFIFRKFDRLEYRSPAVSGNATLLTMGVTGSNSATAVALANLAQNSNATSFAIEHGDGTTAGVLRFKAYLGATRYIGSTTVSTSEVFTAVARQINGVEQSLWVNGKKDPSTGAYTGNSPGLGYYGSYNMGAGGKLLLSLVWARALTDAEIAAVSVNPWQVFVPQQRRLLLDFGAGAASQTLLGSNCAQTNATSAGAVTQGQLLTVAGASQSNTSNAGSISQSCFLSVEGGAQENTFASGSVVQGRLLAVADSHPENTSSTGAVSQSHALTGDPSGQENTSSAGSVGQGEAWVLTGDNCTQANTSSIAPVTQTHVLTCTNSSITSTSSSGAAGQAHTLAGEGLQQGHHSAAGSIILPSLAADYGFISHVDAITSLETSARIIGFNLDAMSMPVTSLKTEAYYGL